MILPTEQRCRRDLSTAFGWGRDLKRVVRDVDVLPAVWTPAGFLSWKRAVEDVFIGRRYCQVVNTSFFSVTVPCRTRTSHQNHFAHDPAETWDQSVNTTLAFLMVIRTVGVGLLPSDGPLRPSWPCWS